MKATVADIDTSQWLALRELSDLGEGTLRVFLDEASTAEADPLAAAREAHPAIRRLIAESRPIVHCDQDRRFEVFWPSYVAYSVRNESYTDADPDEQFVGCSFVVYSKSRYLDFLANAPFASRDYPGVFRHWGLLCLDHIVDVVSVDEPSITMTRGA